MEWLLIAATVVSLGLAVAMSVVAWRLLRRDHERSAARIEALEAMAFAEPEPEALQVVFGTRMPAPADAARAQMSPALPLAAPSPEQLAPPRGQSDASWDALLSTQPDRTVEVLEAPIHFRGRADAISRPLFDEPPAQRMFARRSLAVATMVLVLAGVAGTIALVRSPGLLAVVSASVPSANRPAVNGTPLELLSLRHAMDPAGVFSVTGLVQNPRNGHDIEELEAVLYLFDETGQFFTSGRAPLEIPTLGPGDESAFMIRIPTVATISRYRVGFRRADGRAVAHVDHRGQLPEGTTGDVLPPEPDVVTPARATRPGSTVQGGVASR